MKDDFNPAQFIILGIDGQEVEDDLRQLIETTRPAGFLLLGTNYRDENQLGGLVSNLKSLCGGETIFAVDQEPGRVQRFKSGFPLSKKPEYYLRQGNMNEYKAWCAATAQLMSSIGINLNLAPVLDLSSDNSNNPVLQHRTFGDDAEKVSAFALIMIEEFRRRGIKLCAKHFPGLGSSRGDPHDVLSISDDSLERFLDYHWKPFKVVAGSGVDCIMTTHLFAAAIDSQYCATYSKNAIGHLKHTIGHKGIIISDDLYMGGANSGDSPGQAAVSSIMAGHNLVIVSRTTELQREAIEYLARRYVEDEGFKKAADENMKKVRAFRNAL